MIQSNLTNKQQACLEIPEISLKWVSISDFFVEQNVFSFRYECDYTTCKGCCCSDGCWIGHDEKLRISGKIEKIAEYLRERTELPFWKQGPLRWEFTDPIPEDEQWHTRVIGGTCIFQMPDGRCSIHAYCLDNNLPWEQFKFWICVDFPLSFSFNAGAWYIRIHREVPEHYWDHCACIRPEKVPPHKRAQLPLVIYFMKSTFINRIGSERYAALLDYFNRYVKEGGTK